MTLSNDETINDDDDDDDDDYYVHKPRDNMHCLRNVLPWNATVPPQVALPCPAAARLHSPVFSLGVFLQIRT
jgi:hypothetical protein